MSSAPLSGMGDSTMLTRLDSVSRTLLTDGRSSKPPGRCARNYPIRAYTRIPSRHAAGTHRAPRPRPTGGQGVRPKRGRPTHHDSPHPDTRSQDLEEGGMWLCAGKKGGRERLEAAPRQGAGARRAGGRREASSKARDRPPGACRQGRRQVAAGTSAVSVAAPAEAGIQPSSRQGSARGKIAR